MRKSPHSAQVTMYALPMIPSMGRLPFTTSVRGKTAWIRGKTAWENMAGRRLPREGTRRRSGESQLGIKIPSARHPLLKPPPAIASQLSHCGHLSVIIV